MEDPGRPPRWPLRGERTAYVQGVLGRPGVKVRTSLKLVAVAVVVFSRLGLTLSFCGTPWLLRTSEPKLVLRRSASKCSFEQLGFVRTVPTGPDALSDSRRELASQALCRARLAVTRDVVRSLYRKDELGGLTMLRNTVSAPLARLIRKEAESMLADGRLGPTGREDQGRGQGLRLPAHKDAGRPDNTWGQLRRLFGMDDARELSQFESRFFTVILYLQDGWDPEWGGAFRAYRGQQPGSAEGHVDVDPEGGALMLFRSNDLLHEVLPVARRRFSLSMFVEMRGP